MDGKKERREESEGQKDRRGDKSARKRAGGGGEVGSVVCSLGSWVGGGWFSRVAGRFPKNFKTLRLRAFDRPLQNYPGRLLKKPLVAK